MSVWAKLATQDCLIIDPPGFSEIGSDLKISWADFLRNKTNMGDFNLLAWSSLVISLIIIVPFQVRTKKIKGEMNGNAKKIRQVQQIGRGRHFLVTTNLQENVTFSQRVTAWLFSAQCPPRMSHFPRSNINGADFRASVRSFRSSYAVETQGWAKWITEKWTRGCVRTFRMKFGALFEAGFVALSGIFSKFSLIYYNVMWDDVIPFKSHWKFVERQKTTLGNIICTLLRNFAR